MPVSCGYCVLGRGLCVGLITRLEELPNADCATECDREASIVRRSCSTTGCPIVRGGSLSEITGELGSL